MLSVREIIGTLPDGTKPIAGVRGLDRDVTWVAGLRARPPILPVLTGGELVLVAVAALDQLEPPVPLADAIRRLGERGVAAVGVAGRIEPAACKEADRLAIPLLALPPDAVLTEIESHLVRLIGDRRTEQYQWGLDLERQLTDISISGGGISGMVAYLAAELDAPVIWQDALGRVITVSVPASSGLTTHEASALLPEVRESRLPHTPSTGQVSKLPTCQPEWNRWGIRIQAARRTIGYLSVLVMADRLGTRERLALERASIAFVQEAAKERAVLAAESRHRGDLLNAVLTAPAGDLAEIERRGRALGLDPRLPYRAVVFDVQSFTPESDGVDQAIELLTRRLASGQLGKDEPLLRPEADAVVAVFPTHLNDQTRQIVDAAIAAVEGMLKTVQVTVGVGGAHTGVAGIRNSLNEARTALEIGRGLHQYGRVIGFQDLGAYRLLFALRDHPELSAFFEETLGALRRYDDENRTQLVQTLEAYFAADGVLTTAAARLYLHRNSLAYRLKRIEEITGLSLESAEDRFRMQLALKIWRLLPQYNQQQATEHTTH